MLFRVPGMNCGHCVATIEKAIHQIDQSAVVKADLDLKQLNVVSQAPEEDVRRALDAAGYPAK